MQQENLNPQQQSEAGVSTAVSTIAVPVVSLTTVSRIAVSTRLAHLQATAKLPLTPEELRACCDCCALVSGPQHQEAVYELRNRALRTTSNLQVLRGHEPPDSKRGLASPSLAGATCRPVSCRETDMLALSSSVHAC